MRRLGLFATACIIASGLVFGEELPTIETQVASDEKVDQLRAYYGSTSYATEMNIRGQYTVGMELAHEYSERWSLIGAFSYSKAELSGEDMWGTISGEFSRVGVSYSGAYHFARFERYQVYGRAGIGMDRVEITSTDRYFDGYGRSRNYKIAGTEVSGILGLGITSTIYNGIGLGGEARLAKNIFSKMDQGQFNESSIDLKNELVDGTSYSLLGSITYAF